MTKQFKSVFAVVAILACVALPVGALLLAHTVAHIGPMALLAFLAVVPFLAITSTENRFQETPCKVVVSNNYDTHGTITRTSVDHLTPAQLEALFRPNGLFADMDSWFRTAFEMKACGIKTNGMYDWVMSSMRNIGQLLSYEKVDRGPSLLKPFILGRQDSVINKDFWAVSAGWANNGYTGGGTTGPLSLAQQALGVAGDRIIRVVNRYGIDLDAKWFVDRDRIHLFGRTGGQTTNGQWKVIASAVATDLSYIDVLVSSENAGSATPYDAAPTAGVILAGGNNVNDFESWCQNRPTLDPRKRVPFWYQTMRRGRRVDSEYKKVFARLMESNEYFRQFGDLDLAERNRQDEEEWQRRWLHTFFFGKKISANQTLALWQNLEPITTVTGSTVDPGLGGKVVAYRANMIGIFEQLLACDRVRDLQNNPLNLYEFLKEIYNIMRARKSQGKVMESVDCFTDAQFAADFETAMIAYYKKEYGDILRIQIDEGSNELGFHWRTFKVKFPVGIKINIVTHEFFDDIQNAFETESIGSAGRFLLILDIGKPGPKGGTIYPGMIATNKKVRTLGELEQLARIDPTFACTMESITEEITLISETCTAICECPANSLWIQGIAAGPPSTEGLTANPTYGNLY
jgi:hypothetical protein